MSGSSSTRPRPPPPPFRNGPPPPRLPPEGLNNNEFNLFNYDSNGVLLTELSQELAKFTLDTGILGLDCTLVGVKTGSGRSRRGLAKVSVVNQYGYCLYHKFVIVTPTRLVEKYKNDMTGGGGQQDLSTSLSAQDDVAVAEIKTLIHGHILVGLGLIEVLGILDIDHPKKLRREIKDYLSSEEIELIFSHPKLKCIVKGAFIINPDSRRKTCSVKNAQAAITLYRAFQTEWEQLTMDRNNGENVLQDILKAFAHRGDKNTVVPQSPANVSGVSNVPNFKYDLLGKLVTPLTPESQLLTGDTGVVSLAYKLISAHKRPSVLGRVSVVNEHGYCLYDSFVSHAGLGAAHYPGKVVMGGVPKDYFFENSTPVNTVKYEVRNLLKNHVVVGHALDKSLTCLEIDHPEKDSWDVKGRGLPAVLGFKAGVTLEFLVQKGLNLHFDVRSCCITKAQAVMALYQKYKTECEKLLRNSPSSEVDRLLGTIVNSSQKSTREDSEVKRRRMITDY